MSHAANDRGHLRTEEQRAAEGWELSRDRREHSGGVDGGTGSDSSESQAVIQVRAKVPFELARARLVEKA